MRAEMLKRFPGLRPRIRLMWIDADEGRRMDEIRRDWLGHARQSQADFVKFGLLIIGGGMIALMTLLGVVLQARLRVDLMMIYEPMKWFTASLIFLLIGAAVQTAAIGLVAIFALDPDTTLTRRATWHAVIYLLGWAAWGFAIVLVLIGVIEGSNTLPDLFRALQAGLHAENPHMP